MKAGKIYLGGDFQCLQPGLIFKGLRKDLRKSWRLYFGTMKRHLAEVRLCWVERQDTHHRASLVSHEINEADDSMCVCLWSVCFWHLIGRKGIQKHVEVIEDRNSKNLNSTSTFKARSAGTTFRDWFSACCSLILGNTLGWDFTCL